MSLKGQKTSGSQHTLEGRLAKLNQLRERDPTSPEAVDELRHALGMKTSLIVARAAEIAGEYEIESLSDLLIEAWKRFDFALAQQSGTKPAEDKGCEAKAACAEALYRLGTDTDKVYQLFKHGIRTIQREPVYGGSVDVAVQLRSTCAFALVRMNDPEVMVDLGDLLMDYADAANAEHRDQVAPARAAAATAIGYSENPAGIPLLRMRVKFGDVDRFGNVNEDVISECFLAMLMIQGEAALPFVTPYLEHAQAGYVEAALVALGQWRDLAALPILQQFIARHLDEQLRRTGYLAIAMMRSDQAWDALCRTISEDNPANADLAMEALAIHRDNPAIKDRVESIVQFRNEPALQASYEKHFG